MQQSEMDRLESLGAGVALDEEPLIYDAFASHSASAVPHEAFEAAAFNPFAASAASSSAAAAAAAPASSSSDSSAAAASAAPPKPPRIPKVFFASRTHSQLSQLVSELKSTAYRPGMSVLGSRSQLCINPRVATEDSTAAERNESCKKLLDFNECRFHHNVSRLVNTPAIQPAPAPGAPVSSQPSASASAVPAAGGKHVVWDIEELVAMGSRAHACPYFAARAIAELSSTDLVILPYNYILDPLISRSIGLDSQLEGAVVLIDESHNVEDVSRAAASRECRMDHLRIAEAELTRVQDSLEDGSARTRHFTEARRVVSGVIQWIQENAVRIKSSQAQNQGGNSKFQGQEGEQLTSVSSRSALHSRVRIALSHSHARTLTFEPFFLLSPVLLFAPLLSLSAAQSHWRRMCLLPLLPRHHCCNSEASAEVSRRRRYKTGRHRER